MPQIEVWGIAPGKAEPTFWGAWSAHEWTGEVQRRELSRFARDGVREIEIREIEE
jgi:hypothetical protein